ncbi:MAG: hypothetical protein D6702_06340 [Planctomycetota bacterium]|nr:MAG: hypothetical protein D6702_06340 [Planctomycetota bacterium]
MAQRLFPFLSALALLASALPAQTVLLTEDFNAGLMPPAGWVEGNNGNSLGWEIEGAGLGVLAASNHAFHDDFFGYNDNYLMTPQLNLSGVTQAFAYCDQGVTFASWRDHHYVDVSLDNGVTFINLVDDLAGDGYSVLNVDLSAYVGNPGVNVSYHYTGDYASEWELDNVVVDDVGPPPPPPAWPNLPTAFVPAANYGDDFETYAGVVPPHMAVNELDAVFGQPDPEAWCNIGQHAPALSTTSGIYCLEMGLDPNSNNYHDVRNGLVIGLNGAGVANLDMDFQAIDHGDETDPWDGVWVSDNGIDWYQSYGPWTPLLSTWQAVTGVNLDAVGANTQGDFYLLFAQDDNFPYGYLDGIGIDDISINGGTPTGPYLSVANLVAGGVTTISVQFATPNGIVRHGYSLAGGGPISTPYGDLLLSPPYVELPPLTADSAGNASISLPVPPPAAGATVWLHAFDLGSLTFSNGVTAVVQ